MVHPRRYLLSMENIDGPVAMDSRQTYITPLLLVITVLMKTPFYSRVREKRSIVRNIHIFIFKSLTSAISSMIIEDVKRVCKTGLASMGFFYFDFKDQAKQDARGALSSLLTQFAAQSDAYCESLSALYSAHNAGSHLPSEAELRECLSNMLSLQNRGPMFIIIDAIDECPNSTGTPSPREKVLEFVEWLSNLPCSHLSICVSSRPESDIEAVLLPLASHTVSLHGETGQKEDIVSYVKWFINSDPRARRWRKEDKELVLRKLSERADGM